MLREQILKACRQMLRPIARFAIRNGISWAEFAELGKQTFVKVARSDYGLQGRPTNVARVAIMTGLSRREVTRIKKILTGEEDSAPPPSSRISQILTGWHVDPEFLDKEGRPLALPAEGPTGSLQALLRKYAGDTPHGALSKELIQLGLVAESGGSYRVQSRDYVRGASDPDMLRQGAVALEDHGNTIVYNLDAERKAPARFERMATGVVIAPDDAEAFRAQIEDRGQAFLEEMDQWLAEHSQSPDTGSSKKVVRTGVGVYLIYDETAGKQDDD